MSIDPLRIDELVDTQAFLEFEHKWRELFEVTPDATPFQTWEWISAWWRHAGRGHPLVLIAREGNAPVAAMALAVTRYRATPLRQVRWMGAPAADYQDFVGGERRKECAAAFISHLAAQRYRWDFCDLSDVREGSPIALATVDAPRVELNFHRNCPVIVLPSSWEEYHKRISRRLRTRLRKSRRQLESTFKTIEFTTVSDQATLPQALEDLFRLHTIRWRRRGVAGAFATEWSRAFHRDVASTFLARDWLRLHCLVLDGECRAAIYCYHFGERVFYYLSGFDHALGKYSPGNALVAYSIERAIAEGAGEFDLLRGDEPYKYEWNAEAKTTQRLVFGCHSIRSRLALGLHRLERFVDQCGVALQPRLWGHKPAMIDTKRR